MMNGTVICAGGSICEIDGVQHVDFDADGTTDFSFRDRDFNVRFLIGNAVLRWEHRSGSTVFLVGQRQQNASVAWATPISDGMSTPCGESPRTIDSS